MKVLLLAENIFDPHGGGETTYRHIIRQNPDVHFHVNCAPDIPLPDNCTAYQVGTLFRSRILKALYPRLPYRENNKYAAMHGFDLAAALAGQDFDVIDIPDYMAKANVWRPIFDLYKVTGKVWTLAAHGTLFAAFRNHWWPHQPADLRELREADLATRQVFDAVYGLSHTYLQQYAALGFEPTYADPREMYMDLYRSAHRDGRPATGDARPDMVFIGRLDLCKSPSTFVEAVSLLPRDLYGGIRIFGGDVLGPGGASARAMVHDQLASRRLDYEHSHVPHAQLLKDLQQKDYALLAPSALETFHLGALEALACAVPLWIGANCGFVELIRDLPGAAPFILESHEPADIAVQVAAGLATWAESRATWRALSRAVFEPEIELSFKGIYDRLALTPRDDCPDAEVGDTRAALTAALGPMFHKLLKHPMEQALPTALPARTFTEIDGLWKFLYQYNHRDFEAMPGARQRAVIAPLFGTRHHTLAMVLMGRTEYRLGFPLVAATYFLRADRLGYRLSAEEEAITLTALRTANLAVEADLFERRGDEAYLADYIRSRYKLPRHVEDRTVAATLRSPDPAGPVKVSFVATTLNCADKVGAFLGHLYRAVSGAGFGVELVVVESGSTDDTFAAFEKHLASAPDNLSFVVLRMDMKERIQSAWNRALQHVRGDYVNFIGMDETMTAEGLTALADHLDRNPQTDWAVGDAVVMEVDALGGYRRDIMHYSRKMRDRYDILFESTYSGMVGGMLRVSLFDKIGYFDTHYFAAGDTEFKVRSLAFAETAYVPVLAGTYRDWPEDRVSQNPRTEIEDYSAWYLYRSKPGVAFVLQNIDRQKAEELYARAFAFRKSSQTSDSTDIMLARAIRDAFGLPAPDPDPLAQREAMIGTVMTGFETADVLETLGLVARRLVQAEAAGEAQDSWHPSEDNLVQQHGWLWPVQHPVTAPTRPSTLGVLNRLSEKYRNAQVPRYLFLSECLRMLTHKELPSRRKLEVLRAAWQGHDAAGWLEAELAGVVHPEAFPLKAVASDIAALLGLVPVAAGVAALVSPVLTHTGRQDASEDGLAAWFHKDPAPVSVPAQAIGQITDLYRAIALIGFSDTDTYSGNRLESPVKTGANKAFTVSYAGVSRQAGRCSLRFLDVGLNTGAGDYEVRVNGVPAPFTFTLAADGRQGVLDIAVAGDENMIVITEVSVRLAQTMPDRIMPRLQFGVVLDSVGLDLNTNIPMQN